MYTWIADNKELQDDFMRMKAAHDLFNAYKSLSQEKIEEIVSLDDNKLDEETKSIKRNVEAMKLCMDYTNELHPHNGGPNTYRIYFQDVQIKDDEEYDLPIQIITPSHRYLWNLMVGGIVANKKVIGMTEDQKTIFYGSKELLRPLNINEAIKFIGWSTIPMHIFERQQRTNRQLYGIIETKDLPVTRDLRLAWRAA